MKHKNMWCLELVLGLVGLGLVGLGWSWEVSGERTEMELAKGAYLDPHGSLSIPVTTSTVVSGHAEMVIARGAYLDPDGFLSIPVTTSTVVSGTSSGGAQAA